MDSRTAITKPEEQNFDHQALIVYHQSDKTEGTKDEQSTSCSEKCPICLQILERPSKCGSCSNYFCYGCIEEWIRIMAECPICRKKFQSIFYIMKGDGDHDVGWLHYFHYCALFCISLLFIFGICVYGYYRNIA